jgi:hypothetical protein
MIERQTIDGRDATVSYFDGEFNPVDKSTPGHFAKVFFDDGEVRVLHDQSKDTDDNKRGSHMRAVTLPLPEEGHHEHEASAWSKHRVRTGQKKPLKIYGHHIARWARVIAQQDAQRIATAISVGLTSGESNTDIAHRVIGSRRNNGTDGVTEVTRQHILRLGHGLLKKRKSRMGGHPLDV